MREVSSKGLEDKGQVMKIQTLLTAVTATPEFREIIVAEYESHTEISAWLSHNLELSFTVEQPHKSKRAYYSLELNAYGYDHGTDYSEELLGQGSLQQALEELRKAIKDYRN